MDISSSTHFDRGNGRAPHYGDTHQKSIEKHTLHRKSGDHGLRGSVGISRGHGVGASKGAGQKNRALWETTTHFIQVSFNDILFSPSSTAKVVKLELAGIASRVLTDNLERKNMELQNVELINNSWRRDLEHANESDLIPQLFGLRSHKNERMLAAVTLPLQISVHHPASIHRNEAFDIIIKVLTRNYHFFGDFIRTLPGNENYIDRDPDVEAYFFSFEFDNISEKPTSSPTPRPTLSSTATTSFWIDLVFTGISPDYILSSQLETIIRYNIVYILNANLHDGIDVLNLSLDNNPEVYAELVSENPNNRNLATIVYDDVNNRVLEGSTGDWFHLPLLITVRYPRTEYNRDEILDHTLGILKSNIHEIYSVYSTFNDSLGDEFDGMEVESAAKNVSNPSLNAIGPEEPSKLFDGPSITQGLNQNANEVPWWIWLIASLALATFFLCLISLFCFFHRRCKRRSVSPELCEGSKNKSKQQRRDSLSDRISRKRRKRRMSNITPSLPMNTMQPWPLVVMQQELNRVQSASEQHQRQQQHRVDTVERNGKHCGGALAHYPECGGRRKPSTKIKKSRAAKEPQWYSSKLQVEGERHQRLNEGGALTTPKMDPEERILVRSMETASNTALVLYNPPRQSPNGKDPDGLY